MAVFTGLCRAAAGEMEFVGFMKAGEDVRVAVTNTATHASAWVTVGHSFEGYTVTKFDAATETIVMTKHGHESVLHLKPDKIKPGSLEAPPEIKQPILTNLRKLAAASAQFYRDKGVSTARYDDLVGPTKYVKRLDPVSGEDYRNVEIANGKTMQVITKEGYTISWLP